MDIALLTDIKRKLQIRSALLSIPLDELLGISDMLSPDEIFLEIIKKSLREFENSLPLILDMKVSKGQLCGCANLPGYCEFKSNFTLFLDCIIDESQIILVPNSIPMWRLASMSYPTPGSYTYFSDYRRPYIFMEDVPWQGDWLYIRGICSRPIIPDFTRERKFNPDSKKAAVYWMNIEEGARGIYFLDLCMVNLLDFIRQLKASIALPNMSIDVLGNVDSAYQELRARTEQFVLQSGWYGDLLV